MPSIAILGGGLSGLTAAHSLQRHGHDVTLFESSERVGGRMATDHLDGFRIDAGAQLFASMYERFLALVGDIGLGDRLVRSPGRDAVWRDGRIHEVVYGSVTSMIASGGLPMRTKLRLGATYVPFLSRHAEALDVHAPEKAAAAGLDAETIAEWGNREIDSTFVRSLVYPQLGAYYGSRPEETSAGFYHILAKYGMDVTLYAIAGGAGEVPNRLAERVVENGGSIRTSTPVRGLKLSGDDPIVETEAGSEHFDGVISALPAPALLGLAEGLPEPLAEWLSAVRYRPALTLALLLEKPLGPRYFGLSFPQGETRFVAAITLQANKGVDLVPAGRELLLAFPTPEAAPSLVKLESAEALDRMLPEISRAFPGVQEQVTRARVYRWEPGTPVLFPGYLEHLGAFRSGHFESPAPVAIAGDFLYGPSVEGAVQSGMEAAARLTRRLT